MVDAGRGTGLLEFLLEQGIENVRTVYLSHSDVDHVAALLGLLESGAVTVQRVVVNSDSSKESRIWGDLVYELDLMHRDNAVDFTVGLVAGEREVLDDVEVEIPRTEPVSCGEGRWKHGSLRKNDFDQLDQRGSQSKGER